MLADPSKSPKPAISLEPTTAQQLVDTVGRMSQELVSVRRSLQPRDPPRTITYLPIEASAGDGAVVFSEEPVELEMKDVATDLMGLDLEVLVLAVVRGRSMEPTLRDGDIVIVDRSRPRRADQPEPGRIYLFSVQGEVFIKRAALDQARNFYWKSDNPEHATPVPEDINEAMLGEVVWLWRRAT